MLEIPLTTNANQALQVVLEGQNCSLRLITRNLPDGSEPLFCDLAINNQPVFSGALCLDDVPLPLYGYLGMVGRLVFLDMEGSDAPHWSGLGSRWRLLYLTPAEAAVYTDGGTV